MNPVKYQKTDEIEEKEGKIYDVVRGKWVKATPEERVRQALVASLTKELGYPLKRIREEVPIKMGSTYASKKADVVVYAEEPSDTMHIIFETKKPKRKDGVEQLKSYMNATGVYFGGWLNGTETAFLFRRDPNIFEYLPRLPAVNEDIDNVRKPLTKKDLQPIENLKEAVQDLENTVLANAGVSAFDGIFPMLFAKLWDEFYKGLNDTLDFRTTTAPLQDQAKRLKGVFTQALKTWQDVLFEQDWPNISPESLITIASALQHLEFQDADLDVIDAAFEYMINPEQKADKGQFFTPRPIVKMAVKMLNPKPNELLIDPACGPCGFMIHSLYWVVDRYLKAKYGLEWKEYRTKYAQSNLFAIDFDPRLVKVAKAMMLIAGDGRAHVYRVNSLDSREWKGRTDGLVDAIKDGKFDVLMTNPPFAGQIKQPEILGTYDLAYKGDPTKHKRVNKLTRDVLFIERCLSFLCPGGRMAIVLPQGNLNNTNAEYIRKYVMDKARILAVVGLHVNTFKPFTGTKTSVLFLQKWHSEDAMLEDYPIFMGVNEKPVKDNSGEYIYQKDKGGNILKDEFGKPIIDHDLDETAKEFVKFAKEQKLDFWKD
jgi:type I restriction enzyme M protein